MKIDVQLTLYTTDFAVMCSDSPSQKLAAARYCSPSMENASKPAFPNVGTSRTASNEIVGRCAEMIVVVVVAKRREKYPFLDFLPRGSRMMNGAIERLLTRVQLGAVALRENHDNVRPIDLSSFDESMD